MDYLTLQTVIILFGAGIALTIALMQVLLVKKTAVNYVIIAVCFSIVVFHLSSNYFIFQKLPYWYELYGAVRTAGITASFILQALIFLWLNSLLTKELKFKGKTLLHFLPAVLNILILTLFGHHEPNTAIPPELYNNYMFDQNILNRIVSLATFFQTVVYTIWISILYFPVLIKASKEKRSNLYAALLLLAFMLLSIVVYLDSYIGKGYFTLIMQSRMTIFITVIFIAGFKYPFVMNIVKLEAYRDEYANSRIAGIDVDALAVKLDALMTTGRIFEQSNLTVTRTAEALGIQPYQLTEFINVKGGMTFPQYLKQKRVEAAKALIIERPQDKLISIAYDCGFSSLSSFNESFKAITGLTPSQYRSRFGK